MDELKRFLISLAFILIVSLVPMFSCTPIATDITNPDVSTYLTYQVTVSNQSEWEIGKIAYGVLPSLTFDSQGIPHLSYFDHWRVRYATVEESAWTTTPLEATEHVRPHAIVVDQDTRSPHVAYIMNSELILATYNAGQWFKEVIHYPVDTERLTLALDQNNYHIIVYYDRTSHDIVCIRQDDYGWRNESVASGGRGGGSLSLRIDSLNNPHISYCDSNDFTLKYARWNGTTWWIDTIDACQMGSHLLGVSMAMDSQNRPHIAYTSSNYKLNFASWNGSIWHIQQIHYIQVDVEMISLCLDSSDYPHIGLLQQIHGPISEIMYITYNGSEWLKDLVATDVGWHGVSIALNPQTGQPTILFHREEDDSVYYATQDAWWIQEADIQYYLTVNSSYGDPLGQGWYPIGSLATISVTTPTGFGIQHVFTGWTGDIASSSPSTVVLMNADKTVVATWAEDYMQLITLGVVFTLLVSAMILLERRQRTDL